MGFDHLRILQDHVDLAVDFKKIPGEVVEPAISEAREAYDNLRVFRPVNPLELQRGWLVAFTYSNPDENEPWRFGVVHEWHSGAWCIFTLNLRWKKTVNKNVKNDNRAHKVPTGPDYRNYRVDNMIKTRRYLPGKPEENPLQDDLRQIGEAAKRIFGKFFGEQP